MRDFSRLIILGLQIQDRRTKAAQSTRLTRTDGREGTVSFPFAHIHGDEQYLTNNGFVIWTRCRLRDNASSVSLLWKSASGRKITSRQHVPNEGGNACE